MLTNGCATLYNRWEEEDAEQCIRTVLPAVFWQGEAQGGFTGRRYSKKGKEARYNALILVPGDRLPADRSYLPPRQWLALPKEEKKQFFTFQIGDVLVRGDCPFIWSEQNPLRELVQTYDHLASLRTIRKVEKPADFLTGSWREFKRRWKKFERFNFGEAQNLDRRLPASGKGKGVYGFRPGG